MDIKDKILNERWGGGTADWDFLNELINDFDINEDRCPDLLEDLVHCEDVNSMILYCFGCVKDRLEDEFEITIETNFYANCIDSHLYIYEESVHSWDEAKETVENNINNLKEKA